MPSLFTFAINTLMFLGAFVILGGVAFIIIAITVTISELIQASRAQRALSKMVKTSKFHVGDLVVLRTGCTYHNLSPHKIYAVTNVYMNCLSVQNDEGRDVYYSVSSFLLFAENVPTLSMTGAEEYEEALKAQEAMDKVS